MLSSAQLEEVLAGWDRPVALVAIDGLPLSGKSTLAERLSARFGWAILAFDDFFLPPEMWPPAISPAFPFPFFRVTEFREAVRALRAVGRCSWNPIDWPTLTIAQRQAKVEARGAVIVEGCSVLDPVLAPLYDVRLFVESDRDSVAKAQHARDGENVLSDDWRKLFMPSVDAYMKTDPQSRSDLVVAGRGVVASPTA